MQISLLDSLIADKFKLFYVKKVRNVYVSCSIMENTFSNMSKKSNKQVITGQSITRLNSNSVSFMLMSILLTRRSCRVKTVQTSREWKVTISCV